MAPEMEFDEDSSSEMEFNEDSSSEMEFDGDSDETPRLIVDAKDFEGNDTNVHFIVGPLNVAAEKADEILNNTLARMKIILKSKFGILFRLGYELISTKCKCDYLGRNVYGPRPMEGPASKCAGCYKVQVAGWINKDRVKTG